MNTNMSVFGGKKISTIFLQGVIVIIGLGVFTFLLWEPHLEGRNASATLFEIYFKDPFLAYVYVASVFFFVSLYKAFKVLGFIRQNLVFSSPALKALRTIKYCAIIQSILIVGAMVYIRIFHSKEDDPAGFIALGILATLTSVVIATSAGMFERLLQKAVDIRSENDLTV